MKTKIRKFLNFPEPFKNSILFFDEFFYGSKLGHFSNSSRRINWKSFRWISRKNNFIIDSKLLGGRHHFWIAKIEFNSSPAKRPYVFWKFGGFTRNFRKGRLFGRTKIIAGNVQEILSILWPARNWYVKKWVLKRPKNRKNKEFSPKGKLKKTKIEQN